MSHDAYAPHTIAAHVRDLGVTKARRDTRSTLILGVLAGAFIALGALFSVTVVAGSTLGFGPTRLLGGTAFSLGLVLVIIAGAELFTGNNLIAMAWASGLIRTKEVLRNWLLVYFGNLIGALGTVGLALIGDWHHLGGGVVGTTLVEMARHKASLGPLELLALAILCNALVCLAVWLAMAGRSVVDKVVAIVFPISAFVAMGFEHVIANLCIFPYGMALDDAIPLGAVLGNLALATLGNLLGGTVLVAGVYWLAYLRNPPTRSAP
jgi:formate/nitrite transporter